VSDLPPPPPPPSGFIPPGGGLPGAGAPQFVPPSAVSGRDAAYARPAATWGQRAGALLLDLLFQLLVVVAVAVLVAAITGGDEFTYEVEEDDVTTLESLPYWAAWAGGLGVLLVLTYPWVVMGLMRGSSPGRRIVGIRVLNRDGSRPGFGKAFLREGVTKGALGLFTLPLLLSYLWPLWDPHQRALHDLVCSTRAVQDDDGGATDAFGGGSFAAPVSAPGPPRSDGGADDGLAGRIGLGG